ncbi:MAG: tyrosine protein kinase, partial [Clostridiaceae bacterium]|nr:tyrosine protein kinase [Clostridiaceae bacterium]
KLMMFYKDKLERAGAKIIGVVLNKIDMSGGDYYYYTYYHQNAGGKQKKKPRIALF